MTILVVGGAIIFFGVVVPPRLGPTMEFSVALMLILLAVSTSGPVTVITTVTAWL